MRFEVLAPTPGRMPTPMPMMAERTLIRVDDVDFFKQAEGAREQYRTIFADLPEYCCLVLYYDTAEWKPNGTMRKLNEVFQTKCERVEFGKQSERDLVAWIQRHFKAHEKWADDRLCQYLIFLTDGTMTTLAGEIEKVASYAKGQEITKGDMDAVVIPALSAQTFDISNAITDGNYDAALRKLQDLYAMQTEPILILGAIGSQLRRLLEQDQAPATRGPAEAAGVRLMSIHKSKGLEFPIVILADLDHAFSRQDFDTPVLVHPALGLGPLCIDLKRKIRYPTMARLALEEKLRRENLAEEQRILYVAMTRPKEKLILVDALYGAEKRLQKLTAAAACPVMPEVVAEGKCFGDWILLPLLCRPEAAPLRDMAGVMAGGLYTGDTAPWQVFIHDGDDFGWAPGVAVSDTEKDAGETLFDPALLTFRYPYQWETTLPAKLTATQLKGRALDQEIAEDAYHTPYIRPLVQPKFRREKKGLTPAERGTAPHLVLQYLDLQNLDVPGQVEKLRLEAKLTAEQAAAVDVPALRRFLESPLAEEMRQAETAAREYRFTVLMPARDYDPAAAEEDSILLQGVVDCWFETPEGITVVDFKTDFVQTEEDVAQHAELYRGQLAAYSLALERVLEKAVTRKALYFLQAGKTVEIS